LILEINKKLHGKVRAVRIIPSRYKRESYV